MDRTIAALALASALAGCAMMEEGRAPDMVADGTMTCNAERARAYVGQQATQAAGAAILGESGARSLRWGPPRAAWTMDYREDRVNVRYDDAMKIIEITCG